jgi:plasmid stabilization system protein ParE
MMRVRWAPEAADDLSRIFEYTRLDSEDAAYIIQVLI